MTIDVPTSVKVLFIGSAICIIVAGMINGATLRQHLRDHHAAVLRKLGYPDDYTGEWVRPEQEAQVTAASWAYLRFLRRREFRKLQDDRLNELAERHLWLLRALMLFLIVFSVGLFVVS
jgi:hypothetical protein